ALMELVATGHGAAADGGVGLEGDAHQAELQQARPTGPARGSSAAAGDEADGIVVVWRGVEHGRGSKKGKGARVAAHAAGATRGPSEPRGGRDRKANRGTDGGFCRAARGRLELGGPRRDPRCYDVGGSLETLGPRPERWPAWRWLGCARSRRGAQLCQQ